MPEPRKVYIATCKSEEARESAFRFLGNDFDYRVTSPEEAEFILVDCKDCMEPVEWLEYRELPKALLPPVLLVAVDGESDPDFLRQLRRFHRVHQPEVLAKPAEILGTLKWLESILPSSSKKRFSDAVLQSIIEKVKTELTEKE